MRVVIEPQRHPERSEEFAVPRRSAPLYFAQVREDPLLEIEALEPTSDDSLVVVGSAGCTALSLVAAGAGRVTAVDLNPAQNHLIELKLAGVGILPRTEMLAFIGATPGSECDRLDAYVQLRSCLTVQARAYWDARLAKISAGVLNAGVTERFIRLLTASLRLLVQPRRRIERMLACDSVEEQRELFARDWNTTRWRAFFRVLLNPFVFRRAYDPSFFAHLERPSFGVHFARCAEHALTRLPVRDNYFLHHMLLGRYPVDVDGGVPPYLSHDAYELMAARRDALAIVDGTMTDHLRTLPNHSVSGFALSNICEWLAPRDLDALFSEIVRTAVPGARLCFRNFVGWTDVPVRFREVVIEDRARGDAMIQRDRSVVQRRFAVCRVGEP